MELIVPSGIGSGTISPLSARSCIFMVQSRARERGALVVKTDWNWALCMVDFSLVSVTKVSYSVVSLELFEWGVGGVDSSSASPRRPSR